MDSAQQNSGAYGVVPVLLAPLTGALLGWHLAAMSLACMGGLEARRRVLLLA